MNISEPFIKRPVGTSLLALGVLLAGIVAYRQLPVAPLPQVEFPVISVSAALPGASPETMASAVATPLERQFGRIAGVTEMTSSSLLGVTTIILQFDLSRSIDAAARDVQAAINAARGQLPPGLPNNPTYRKVNPGDAPVMIIALTSDILPIGKLYDAADSILAQKLAQVDGIGQVIVGGGAKPAVRVQIDPGRLSQLGIGLEDIRAGLRAVNANSPKGALSGKSESWTINATDQLFDADQYRPLIFAYQKGAPVSLGDVADVVGSVEDVRTAGLANGKRSVVLVLFRQPGTNMIETADRVYDLLPTLRASVPPAITLSVVLDRTTSIRASFRDIQITLLITVILVVFVVFVFLRSLSATLIPSIAVPLSLIGTFAGMYICGYSLDNLSLMALTIVTGFVVDDAIVVLENITRYREAGLSRIGEGRHGRAYRLAEGGFDAVFRLYDRTLRWVLRHQFAMLLLTLVTIGLSLYLYREVPKGLFPQQDVGRIVGGIRAEQDISFPAMQGKLRAFVDIVRADPDVVSVVGFTGGQGGNATNTGRMFVVLKPWGERKLSVDLVIQRLRGKLGVVPGATLFLQAVQDVRIGGRIGNAQYQYTLQSTDLHELTDFAPRMLAKFRTIEGLKDIDTDLQNRGLQATLTIDRDAASRLGISPQLIDDTLYDAFGQRQVSTIFSQLNQYHVVLEVSPAFQQNPDALKSIYVKSSTGAQVPLSAITRFTPSTTPLAVNHQGFFPSVTLSFNLAPGMALGDAVTRIQAAERQMNMPASIHGSFQGTAQAFQASLSNQPILILAAILTVYIVLGVLYESFVHPITILSTLPSAGVGALLALLLTGGELNIIAMIGIILLIGIVKKNAIMMIDFALDTQRSNGKPADEAIYEACLLRFRPIMMTTMAALLGSLPLALGTGDGSELRRPLGITIVGGLLVSQLLTLYTTPVVYLYLERLRVRLSRRAKAPAQGIRSPHPISGGNGTS